MGEQKSIKLTVSTSSVLFNQCSILSGKCVCRCRLYVCLSRFWELCPPTPTGAMSLDPLENDRSPDPSAHPTFKPWLRHCFFVCCGAGEHLVDTYEAAPRAEVISSQPPSYRCDYYRIIVWDSRSMKR